MHVNTQPTRAMTNHTDPDLFLEDPSIKARIEIIPLIDVIFFLLATFVLFTLSLNRYESIPITLPQPPPDITTVPQDPVTLQVSSSGIYYWNQERVSMIEVEQRIANYAANDPAPKVMLTSDDQANYGDTIRLLDTVRAAGIEQVSIETRYRPAGL